LAQGKSAQAPGQNKNETGNPVKKQVVIGSLENVSSDSVVIEEKKGKKRTEGTVDQTTKIVGQDKKLLKVGALKLKDMLALISTDSTGATAGGKLKIKKIFVKEATTSAQFKRRAVHGVITNIAGSVLTLAHQIQRERTYSVIVTDQTFIKIKATDEATGSGTLASLTVGQRIVAVGDLNPDGGIIAKRIHVIPGKATGIFRRLPVSTPSASLIATPAASATASSTPTLAPSPSILVSPSPSL
jgi:hypothetical protein